MTICMYKLYVQIVYTAGLVIGSSSTLPDSVGPVPTAPGHCSLCEVEAGFASIVALAVWEMALR